MPICNHPRGDVTGAPCAACAETFCACGRRESECDGSRARCVSRKTAPRIDTSHRDAPMCPKCGREGPETQWKVEGDRRILTCGGCGTRYLATTHVTVTYSTEVRP